MASKLYSNMQTQLVVLQGDITQLNVDAIVGKQSLTASAESYRDALLRARSDSARSVAFPCVGCESDDVEVALKTVRDFVMEYPGSFSEIIFACWDAENYGLYKRLLGGENRIIFTADAVKGNRPNE